MKIMLIRNIRWGKTNMNIYDNNYESIQKKITLTNVLINRDNLIIPGEKEEAISELVISQITKNKDYKIPHLKKSTYDVEMEKVTLNLQKYLQSKEIEEKYQDLIVTQYLVKQCTPPQVYYSTFYGPHIPCSINIPYQLDELSHIHIGHEVMHVFLDNESCKEWKWLFLYSEVIPMLYELIQVSDENKMTKQKVLKWRLSKLLEMYNNIFREDIIKVLQNDQKALLYYQMPEKQYFIAFYYTILLYDLYCQDEKSVRLTLQSVLKQEITTKQMLENYGLLKNVDNVSFEKSYSLVLKNHLYE